MELIDAIRGRRSIRVFTDEPVDRATVEHLLGAAVYAPSRMNTQPWRFHVAMGEARTRVASVMAQTTTHLADYIDGISPETLEHAAAFYADLGAAPVVIAISAPVSLDSHEAHDTAVAVGAALQNLLLAAHEAGIGGCGITAPHWIGDQLAAVFDVPGDREIALIVLLGHPLEEPRPVTRELDVITFLS